MSDQPARQKQLFPKWINYLLPLVVLGAMGGALYMPVVVGYGLNADTLNVGYRPEQPVPYSHELHVGRLGIDCMYCHTTVEDAGFASIPPTQTCINCHHPETGIRVGSPKLKEVHESYATGEPIEWVKVHDLADYAYFNHSAHINKGVGCYSCHGRVDKMDEAGVYQVSNLSMGWCLECHRAPEKNLRPREEVTNMTYHTGKGPGALQAREGESLEKAQIRVGLELKEKYNVQGMAYMTACSTCHR